MDHPLNCPNCGYDLRGQVAPRCPECGIPYDPGKLKAEQANRLAPIFHRHCLWAAGLSAGCALLSTLIRVTISYATLYHGLAPQQAPAWLYPMSLVGTVWFPLFVGSALAAYLIWRFRCKLLEADEFDVNGKTFLFGGLVVAMLVVLAAWVGFPWIVD